MYTMIPIQTEVPVVPPQAGSAEPAVQTLPATQDQPYLRMVENGKSRCGKLTNAEVQAFMRRRRAIDILESLFWLLAVIYLFMLIFIKKG